MFKTKLVVFSLALMPILALAQAQFDSNNYFKSIAESLAGIIGVLIPAAMGLVFIAFFWYLYKYIMGNAEDKEKSKSGLLWSVIAIVIMLSIYGIANLLQTITGATGGASSVDVPIIPGLE